MNITTRLKHWAQRLRADTYALLLAYRDPRTPWYAKAFAAVVVGYALSPIDLIPDFIPVLGYLDDLLLVPAGIALALRMIPREVLADCRNRAKQAMAEAKPRSWAGAVAVVLIWLVVLVIIGRIVWKAVER